ncbi:hypothetical protein B5807_10132 [Epicoccum nigrum]|uniref:C2H2-type domain-containing protein n=1 Tax=Epicoccum nigrum TaxID=105696 RepID=A0A1Y2LNE3_EPING|nr:hypothetical protein B5807_10132 [Epicoccum nigrum]
MLILPSIQSPISSPFDLDSISHRTCAKVVTVESECRSVESPKSTESAVAERLELDDPKEKTQSSPRSPGNFTEEVEPNTFDLAQEEQTEQLGHVKKWVDSTCVIQSPLSGYSGEGMISSGSDFGIGYESSTAISESEEDRNDTDSESFVLTEYSVNSPDWDPTGAILVPMKLEYINRLLSSSSLVQRQWQSSVASDMAASNHSTGSHSDKRRASSPPSGNSSGSRPPKKTNRQSKNGDNGEGQGGDDDGRNPQNTSPNIAEDGQKNCLYLACPFVKRYPNRYHKCYSHTLKDVARVKYHLFRDKVHRLPIYCPTCSERFALEDLRDEHVRASNCTMKPQFKWEGITASQREKLNKRLPSTNSAADNWNAVYKILFPGDPLPDSPYIDTCLSRDLVAFREHALLTGPSIWNEILRARLPEHLRSSLEELQSFHRSFHSEAVTRLFETWGSSRSTTRSFQSQSSSTFLRQDTVHLVPPIPTVDGSSSPSGSDSALGRSVTNGSQSETGPSSASLNEVAPPAQTQQQQNITQRDPRIILVPQQPQTTPSVPPSIPQTPSFTHMQTMNFPPGAQYPFGSADFTGYEFPQNAYEPVQVPTFTTNPGGRQMFNPQYALGTIQLDPGIDQFRYQPPPANLPQGAFYQPHQMQIQPQHPYNINASNPHALNPMGPVWAPPK